MKIASYTSIAIILVWGAMSLYQLWGDGLDWDLYIKISLTMLLIGSAVVLASLIAKEYLSEKKMKKDKFID